MTAYTVRHNYSSFRDGQQFGPWTAGTRIELEPADADWVNRDSPGCLELEEPPAVGDPDEEPPAPAPKERAAKPSPDRQHRGGANRGA